MFRPEASRRLQGYIAAHKAFGLEPDPDLILADGDGVCRNFRTLFLDFLQRKLNFTALVALNDHAAIEAAGILKKQKIRIPDDVAVVGYDNISRCSWFQPPLASVNPNSFELGYKAFQSVANHLCSGEPMPGAVLWRSRFVPRLSCGVESSRIQSIDPESKVGRDELLPKCSDHLMNNIFGLSREQAEGLCAPLVAEFLRGGNILTPLRTLCGIFQRHGYNLNDLHNLLTLFQLYLEGLELTGHDMRERRMHLSQARVLISQEVTVPAMRMHFESSRFQSLLDRFDDAGGKRPEAGFPLQAFAQLLKDVGVNFACVFLRSEYLNSGCEVDGVLGVWTKDSEHDTLIWSGFENLPFVEWNLASVLKQINVSEPAVLLPLEHVNQQIGFAVLPRRNAYAHQYGRLARRLSVLVFSDYLRREYIEASMIAHRANQAKKRFSRQYES
ncbi:MAG: substrate-binding domain-containing protein [Verrucomicrobia bacterium]|nr:substrate-binding domain-containing protein [Verrucomicrobiota bacterium]